MIKELELEHNYICYVSDDGKIYNSEHKELVQHLTGTSEYYRVRIQINGKRKRYTVHRLVALAFIPNPENLPTVNHKDGNKLNNCVDNLEWSSYSENIKHAFKNNLNPIPNGELNHEHILTEEEVKEIRKIYSGIKGQQTELANIYGVSNITIFDIVHNKTWKHIL